MNSKRAIALASATLVAGLVVGNISGAFAARPVAGSADAPTAACESGLRIGPMIRDAGGRMHDILANLTGLSADEVREQRTSGASAAEIAESAGVRVDAVVGAALDARENALDDAVAAGTLTREQADAALERMRERVAERVNSTETGRQGGGMGAQARAGRGPGGERGSGGACGTGVCPNTQ